MDIKQCKTCLKVKNINSFYTGGASGKAILGNCKGCHNKKRNDFKKTYKYVKKPTGFNKLDKKTQESIKYDLAIKKTKKSIALKNNISYVTFRYWCKKGIPPYEGEIKIEQ